jgi:hypothetical protein
VGGCKFCWLDGATHANSFDRKRLDADWQRACDEATANYDDARKAAAQGVASGLPTFKDLAAAFITYQQFEIANGERTPERVKFYRDTLDVVLPHLGHLLADAITSEEAVAMKTKLGASAEVYYKQVQLVRQVLQHAMDKKLVPNIIIKPDLPKRPTTRRAAINANGQWAKLTGYLAARANAIDKDKEYDRWFIRRMLHCYVLVMGSSRRGCKPPA